MILWTSPTANSATCQSPRRKKKPGEEVASAAAAATLVDPEGKTRTGKHLAHLWIHEKNKSPTSSALRGNFWVHDSRSGISAAAAAAALRPAAHIWDLCYLREMILHSFNKCLTHGEISWINCSEREVDFIILPYIMNQGQKTDLKLWSKNDQ